MKIKDEFILVRRDAKDWTKDRFFVVAAAEMEKDTEVFVFGEPLKEHDKDVFLYRKENVYGTV